MKNIAPFTYILFFLFSTNIISQNSQQVQDDFMTSLIKEETATDNPEYVKINLSEKIYSISDEEGIDPYSVSFNIITYEDLNGDGIKDYIILRNSMGMLGGNANTNSEYRYYIMENDTDIRSQYTILAYAPFSYNVVEDATFDNNRLVMDIVQNHRTYFVNSDDLKTTKVSFIYKDNNLYEESYLTSCEMAKMKDKRIFKADTKQVSRNLDIDMHNYTEIASENYESETAKISTTLCGCDNFMLNTYFSINPNRTDHLQPKDFQQEILKILDFMKENTRYKTIFDQIIKLYTGQTTSDGTSSITFNTTWNANIHHISHDTSNKRLNGYIDIENKINERQTENWEITVRQK